MQFFSFWKPYGFFVLFRPRIILTTGKWLKRPHIRQSNQTDICIDYHNNIHNNFLSVDLNENAKLHVKFEVCKFYKNDSRAPPLYRFL